MQAEYLSGRVQISLAAVKVKEAISKAKEEMSND